MIMKNNLKYCAGLLLLIIILVGFKPLFAQTNVHVIELTPADNTLGYNRDTLKAWIQNIFHGGGGLIDTSTIRFTGNHQAMGRFYDGVDLGFDKGLIISTGKVVQAEPPNSIGAMTHEFTPFDPFSSTGDDDLLDMYNTIFMSMGGKDTTIYYTGDAAAIEFVYQPYGDQILLDYVFASEEYPSASVQPSTDIDLTGFNGQAPNTQIFDLFGISLERNPNYFHNLAFLQDDAPPPGTSEEERWITVQKINASSYSSYYKPNPYVPPIGPTVTLGTQFDALTKTVGDLGPLNIRKKDAVQCKRYNVKIVIEDFFWNSPDPDQLPSGFQINSAVILGGKSLKSNVQLTGVQYSDWSVDYHFLKSQFNGDLIENCNHIIATFTLNDSIAEDYSIPFKIVPAGYRDSVEVAYEGGAVITNDSIKILRGETEVKITISSANIAVDHSNISFRYPKNPCDLPPPPPLSGGFNGKINFNMRVNEPFSFTENPKIYSAYCKETLDLTVTDVTQNGVTPLFYRWNNDILPYDTISYQVQSSPDLVKITVNDYCDNLDSTWIQINNKPVILEPILDAFLCGPGQSVIVPVSALIPDYPDYTIDHVTWWKVSPHIDLGDASGNEITVLYDDVVGADIWTCGFEITDCCGGTATGTFIVNQSELTLGDNVTICNGDDKTLTANASAQSYSWFATNNPGIILSTTNSVNVSPSVTTEYTLQILDLCNVIQEATITVNVDLFEPQITISPASAEICPGEDITLTANSALLWSWSPGGGATQSITLTPTIPTTYQYTLTASSEFCFNKEVSTSFEVFPKPVAEFSFVPDADACTGEPISFSYSDVVTNETFQWNFGDGSPGSTVANPTHTYANQGFYDVFLHVDKYICKNDTTVQLTINPLPSPDFEADVVSGCLPVDVIFSDLSSDVSIGAGYEWTFGDGAINNDNGNTSHSYTQAGLFDVSLTISNTQRCAETLSKSGLIQANPNPQADFEANPYITTLDTPTIEFNDISLSDSTINNYEWVFGDGESSSDVGNTSHTYTQAGDYNVELRVETINGCWDTTSVKVALTEEVKLFIPNAFTPNGDGINDVFEIKGTPIADFNLYIYDRWGGIIWSTHNYEVRWDGNTKEGNNVPAGTYVYQITGTDYKRQAISFKGTVTVVR